MTFKVRDLTDGQRFELRQAFGLDDGEVLDRYDFYRGKGHSRDAAFEAAMAWGRNMADQRTRRVSHGTGYSRRWLL